jgi:class 3 adenylate cyclase
MRNLRSTLAMGLHRTVDATVLFTDIVDSTAQQAALGDRGWKRRIEQHHRIVREALARWGGVENDTAGDGFYATFLKGPDNAIRCALDVRDRLRAVGILIRAGLHHGTCLLVDGKCCGLTVSIGARVASHAGALEVLVTQAVRDLALPSNLAFRELGEFALKGVPTRVRLFRVGDLVQAARPRPPAPRNAEQRG